MIELTEAHDRITCAADAHVWRATALLELGRLEEADTHLARHAELAELSQQPAHLIHRDGMRSMRAALEGDYERAARIARELFDRGEAEEADGRLLSPIHAQFHGTSRSRSSTSGASWARMRRSSSGWRARSLRRAGGPRSPGRMCRPGGRSPRAS